VIYCHLRDIGGHLLFSCHCYEEKVTKCGNELETGQGLMVKLTVVPLPVSIKDRSLTALLSC